MAKKGKVESGVIFHRTRKVLVWIPVLLVAFLLLSFAMINIPRIQTRTLNSLLQEITKSTSFALEVKHVNLTSFDKMHFQEIRIYEKSTDSTFVSAQEARIDIRLLKLLLKKELHADIIELDKPYVHIIKKNDSTDINATVFINELKELFKKPGAKKKDFGLKIDRVEIAKGKFSFNDCRRDSITDGKDYYHFAYQNLLASVSDFTFETDSIGMEIDRMRAYDPSQQLNIKSFFGKICFTYNGLGLYDFLLNTDKSQLGDSLVFNYTKPSNFSYFIDSIQFESKMKRSIVDFSELALFSSSLQNSTERISITGDISGKVKRLKGKDLDIRLGTRSRLRGNASLYGLPNIKETFVDLQLKNSVLLPIDILHYIPKNQHARINNIGTTQFDASFLGFLSDFVANGAFYTEAGTVITDLNFKTSKEQLPSYTGQLAFEDFDLQSLLPDSKYLGHVTMNGNIKGKGIEKSSAHFTLNAFMDSIGIYGYQYKNITTKGYFEEEVFKGTLTILDPNLAFNGDMDIDLHEDINKIDVSAQLDSAKLHHLGLVQDPLVLTSRIDVDVKGLETDELKGYINLYDNKIDYKGDLLSIDSIKLLSSEIGEERVLFIETEGLTGSIKGKYRNSQLFSSLGAFGQELWMYSHPDSLEVVRYYREKQKKPLEKFQADITFNLWNLNKFVQPFYPSFSLSPDVKVSGVFKQDSTAHLSLYTAFDSLKFNNHSLASNEVDINISKKTLDQEVLAAIYLASANQQWSSKYQSENFILDAIWFQEDMELFLNLEQANYNNHLEVYSNVKFLVDEIQFSLEPSDIKILDKRWFWTEQNQITYKKTGVGFSNLGLHSDDQSIFVDGTYDYDPANKLKINIENFEFQNLQSLIETQISGTLDGNINIQRRHDEDLIESDLVARSLIVEDFLVGNIFALSQWENSKDRLSINLDLIRNQEKKIELGGYFYPYAQDDQLDLKAHLQEAELKIFEPIFASSIDNLAGTAQADLSIKGRISRPEIYGKAQISKGATTINYLRTRYLIDGEILFEDTKIIPNNLKLTDAEGNNAYLSGSISHEGFDDLQFDITGSFNQFRLLNTNSTDNDAYYGTAHATGRIHFGGSIDNLIIIANARTNRGTHIAIPLGSSDAYDIGQQEYIEFVDMSKPEQQETLESKIEEAVSKIKGIQLLFDIEMTPDAYVELIFDIKAGDIIRGRGNGNIKLQINTDGDFDMFGDFEIETGGYNFTLYNIINKEFEIQKGSTISWYGNPYQAQLGINARYKQYASIQPLLDPYLSEEEISASEAARRKYPSIVNLRLTGDLMSPLIKFGIDIEDYPANMALGSAGSLDAIINAFKAKLASNEQEMNRQVFSLLILRKFSPENSFEVNSQTIGSSLSEFVSNQLSYWATQVDENLEIDVDLAGLSDDAFNTFQLRLSYTFLDGRLRVTRGGGIPNSSDENTNNMTSIIGDWSVEYLLTKDGRLRAKMYSRSDLNEVNDATGRSGIETGFSLQYVRSFDEFSQILTDSRNKNKKKNKETPSENPNQEAIKEEDEIL